MPDGAHFLLEISYFLHTDGHLWLIVVIAQTNCRILAYILASAPRNIVFVQVVTACLPACVSQNIVNLDKYWMDFRLIYISDSLWYIDDCFTFWDEKVKVEGHFQENRHLILVLRDFLQLCMFAM